MGVNFWSTISTITNFQFDELCKFWQAVVIRHPNNMFYAWLQES